MAEEKEKKKTKKTAEKKATAATKKPRAKKPRAKKPESREAAATTEATEAKAEKPEAAETKKVKGVRKESARAAAPVAKPRPLPRPVEPSVLELDAETKRLLAARKANKASLPEFRRIDSHKKKKLDPSWRRPKGHHAQLRRQRKSKGAKVKVGYGSPAAVEGFHPSGYQEVLVHRPDDLGGIGKGQAIRIGRTVGRKKQMEIERLAKEQSIKVLNPLNTFEGA